MEDESNSNEPSTSTDEVPASFTQTFGESVAASMEADSGSHLSSNLHMHPQDKTILDMIDKFHTRRATQWALFSWNTWRLQTAQEDLNQPVLPFFFEMCSKDVEVFDKTLANFVTECKNKDNDDYTPETLRGILFGLQRFLKAYCIKMDKKPLAFIKNEYQFPKYCGALKKKIADLNESGIPRKNGQAVGITAQQEEYLWNMGIFGCSSAEVLSNTVFFYVVRIFGIVSSNVLRTMKADTLSFGENEVGKYVELDTNFASELDIYNPTSCCHNLALLAPNTATKLRHYCNEKNPRTFYNLLQYYVDIIKRVDSEENSLFLKPKKEMAYSNLSIGRNQLQRKFCKMMNTANFQGYFTTQGLVQSCLDNLQIKGYMVRRKQPFLPQQQLDISRLLDPPPGLIKITLDVKTQTKAVLQLINASKGPPVQPQYVFIQTPQSGGPLHVTQTKHLQQMDLQTALQASQNIFSAGLYPSSGAASYVSTVPNLTTQLTVVNKALPNNVVGVGTVPVSTGSVSEVNTGQFQNVKLKLEDESALSKECLPVFLRKTENIENCSNTRSSNAPGNDSDGTTECDNIIIKQEPVDSDGNCFQTSESVNANLTEISGKRKSDLDEQTENKSPRKISKVDSTSVTNDLVCQGQEKDGAECVSKDEESVTCSAEIEYSFNNDLSKKITKQEITLTEDDQTMFSFSGTNKMGRTMGDLDINLGDYLPENCTIKPGDINIKRIILPDGGKMVIKLKYSVDK